MYENHGSSGEGEEDREEMRIIEGIIVVVIVGTEATGGETITAIETETTEEDDEGGRWSRSRDQNHQERL